MASRIRHGSDAIPTGICFTCGLIGNHPKAAECIDALRQRIADLEIRVNTLERAKRKARVY